MRLVITNEGEQVRQAFLKDRLNEKKKMESSQMNFEESLNSLNFELTGQAGKINNSAGGGGNTLATSGRNQMNNEYKSYLQGSTNQNPAPLGMTNKNRGASMAPAFSTNSNGKLGAITEIEVSKPDLRLSK